VNSCLFMSYRFEPTYRRCVASPATAEDSPLHAGPARPSCTACWPHAQDPTFLGTFLHLRRTLVPSPPLHATLALKRSTCVTGPAGEERYGSEH